MNVAEEALPGGVTRFVLDGRLDIQGAAAVDSKLSGIADRSKAVIVDLQRVPFLASIGLRSLVIPARALSSRGGRMVILGPTPLVEKVLKTSGIDTVIPIHHDLDSAVAAFG